MSQRALICVVILFCLKVASVNAQVPTLDPSQTVNIQTGAMGFSLPLGVVKGVNGHDFPINLNYNAGISLHQEASEVGLGYSCGVGGITRKVVYVPDDLTGNHFSIEKDEACYLTGWYTWVQPIATMLSIFLTVATLGEALPLQIFVQAFFAMNSQMEFTPRADSYRGAGVHTPAYNYVEGEVKGFFKGGETTDLPDMYILNTPYISGTMLWKETMGDGKELFEMNKNGSAYFICYDKIANIFTATLPNGTKLIFDRRTQYPDQTTTRGRKKEGDTHCYFRNRRINKESVTAEWHLTKVLYSDYLDGSSPVDDNPLNSQVNNKGSWVCFEYDSITGYDLYPENYHISFPGIPENLDMVFQASDNLSVSHSIGHRAVVFPIPNRAPVVHSWNGEESYIRLLTLKKVVTPNQVADYNFTYNRSDAKWYQSDLVDGRLGVQIDRGVLSNIAIKNKDGEEIRKISFTTSYRLREKNGNDGCLTLEKITVSDANGNNLPPIQFDYVENNPPRDFSHYVGDGDNNAGYCIEEKDLWGYYNPTKNGYTRNDFNIEGDITQAENANAWSLKSIKFPTGYAISWDYEPNRYETANAVPVKKVADVSVSKYGGGIRVKKITIENGMGKSKTWSYFYTDENGVFTETNYNSSGYASIEPVAYNLVTEKEDGVYYCDDTRPMNARGGLYSPAVVGYGKVQVVENYDEGNPGTVPYGFMVYDFTTSHAYPNLGDYGQQGMDPIRGMVKNVAVYNKNKLIVSQKATLYDVKIARKKYAALNSNVINDRRKAEEGWGLFFTVVPSEEHEKVNNVEKGSNYSYSSTISDAPDAIEVNNADRYISYEHRGLPLGIDPRVWDLVRYNYYTTDQFGNKGTIGATDIVIVSGHSVANRGTDIGIMVLQDIGELSETFNVPDQQSSYKHLVHLGPSYFTKSVKIADIDGNGTLDIYIKVGIAGGEDVEIKLTDVYIDANGELQSSSGTYNAPTEFDNTLPYMPFRISAEKGMICIRDNQAIIDRDGRPNRTIITNSDRKQLIQEVIPAFTQTVYADMLTKNILTPVCLTKTYGKDAGTGSVPYVVSSSATTWSPHLGNSTWVPNYSFAWNNQKGGYSDFIFPAVSNPPTDPSSSNTSWQLTGTAVKYDALSTPLEAKNAKGISSTTIYRNDVHLPIAAVANSKYGECAVYTCDHGIDNGWEKGSGCSMSVTRKHFGDSSVYVNKNYGPTKNITGFSTAKSYIFSAWVYPLDGNAITLSVEKRIGGIYSGNFGKDFTFTAAEQNKWNHVKVSITPAQLTGMNPGSDYLRIHVSCNPGNNAQFYVDDIRFHPKNALVTTTYYDQKWYQPVLTVDANNNPGQKVEYDEFGRPVRLYKVNKYDPSDKTLLQEKEYHLRNELPAGKKAQILYPDFGGTFKVGDEIIISFADQCADSWASVYCRNSNNGNIDIATGQWDLVPIPGYLEYKWTIPANAAGTNKIHITTPCGNDDSDLEFIVNP